MKTVAVVGMGIIGGSISASLTKAGYTVHGFSWKDEELERALSLGYIQAKGDAPENYEVVFIALPPYATLEYLQNTSFKDDALVCDICGVKQVVENCVYACARNYRYLGLHPMAGKETSGIDSASADLFKNANLVITLARGTKESAVTEVKELAKAMQFGRIVECSASEHDAKIALTSQLAHIVSNAYVKSPQVQGCEGFTGGSFQDMTRIAGVDEKIWTPLYAYNRENLICELNGLIDHLCVYRDALKNKDDDALFQTLLEGRLIRETIRRKNDD